MYTGNIPHLRAKIEDFYLDSYGSLCASKSFHILPNKAIDRAASASSCNQRVERYICIAGIRSWKVVTPQHTVKKHLISH